MLSLAIVIGLFTSGKAVSCSSNADCNTDPSSTDIQICDITSFTNPITGECIDCVVEASAKTYNGGTTTTSYCGIQSCSPSDLNYYALDAASAELLASVTNCNLDCGYYGFDISGVSPAGSNINCCPTCKTQCSSNDDCYGGKCDTGNGVCVQCLTNWDCNTVGGATNTCTDNVCVEQTDPGCTSNGDCVTDPGTITQICERDWSSSVATGECIDCSVHTGIFQDSQMGVSYCGVQQCDDDKGIYDVEKIADASLELLIDAGCDLSGCTTYDASQPDVNCCPSCVTSDVCLSDDECAAPTPKCNSDGIIDGECVACLIDGDCTNSFGSHQICASNACVSSTGCTDDSGCTDQRCKVGTAPTTIGECVDCLTLDDCEDTVSVTNSDLTVTTTTGTCNDAGSCEYTSVTTGGCTDCTAPELQCKVATVVGESGVCVECLTTADCVMSGSSGSSVTSIQGECTSNACEYSTTCSCTGDEKCLESSTPGTVGTCVECLTSDDCETTTTTVGGTTSVNSGTCNDDYECEYTTTTTGCSDDTNCSPQRCYFDNTAGTDGKCVDCLEGNDCTETNEVCDLDTTSSVYQTCIDDTSNTAECTDDDACGSNQSCDLDTTSTTYQTCVDNSGCTDDSECSGDRAYCTDNSECDICDAGYCCGDRAALCDTGDTCTDGVCISETAGLSSVGTLKTFVSTMFIFAFLALNS